MKVDVLSKPDPACDDFVCQRDDGNIAHLWLYSDVIARAMGLKSYYLIARKDGKIQGVLPLIYVKSYLFGKFMVSQAFSNYGGPLTETQETCDAIFNRAVEIATKLNCRTIEFRNIQPLPYDLKSRTGKMCMHLSLDSNPDTIWQSFKAKVRNQIRKAEKSNIIPAAGRTELLNDFYRVYTIRMKQLGTPPYSRKLIQYILEAFPDNSRLFVVRLDGLTIGAALTIHFNNFVEIPLASTLTQYNNLCPNNLLYWAVIKHYCLAGAKCFDFGRCTTGGPTHRFKKQWGPEPVELHYQYWVRPGHQLSVLSPDNPEYQKKVEMWKKLPLWLSRLIGPIISRNLP